MALAVGFSTEVATKVSFGVQRRSRQLPWTSNFQVQLRSSMEWMESIYVWLWNSVQNQWQSLFGGKCSFNGIFIVTRSRLGKLMGVLGNDVCHTRGTDPRNKGMVYRHGHLQVIVVVAYADTMFGKQCVVIPFVVRGSATQDFPSKVLAPARIRMRKNETFKSEMRWDIISTHPANWQKIKGVLCML